MRTSFLTTACLVLLLSSASRVPAQDWAKALFKGPTSFNFGVVARGAAAEHRFVFENIYLEDIHIASVRSSCGCTKPTVAKPLVKTYEQSEIVATLDTRRFHGQREATITVVLDQPFPAEVQLHVYGYIRSDVVVQPGEAKFESVSQGSASTQTLTVSYAGRPDWKILQVKTGNPYVEAKAVERGRGEGLVTYDLQVQLKPNTPAGYLRDQLILVTNDNVASATQVPVAVEAVIVPSAQVRPSPLSLGILRPGQSVTRNLVVQARSPFRILNATGPDGRFTFQKPSGSKPLQLLPLTFEADETMGRIGGKIRIETDIAGTPVLEVGVDGQIVPREPGAASTSAPSSVPSSVPSSASPKSTAPASAVGPGQPSGPGQPPGPAKSGPAGISPLPGQPLPPKQPAPVRPPLKPGEVET